MPTSPRHPAKKGGSVTKPKAAKVKRYEIKPLRWKSISPRCLTAGTGLLPIRVWRLTDKSDKPSTKPLSFARLSRITYATTPTASPAATGRGSEMASICICGKQPVLGGWCQMKDGKGYCNAAPNPATVPSGSGNGTEVSACFIKDGEPVHLFSCRNGYTKCRIVADLQEAVGLLERINGLSNPLLAIDVVEIHRTRVSIQAFLARHRAGSSFNSNSETRGKT